MPANKVSARRLSSDGWNYDWVKLCTFGRHSAYFWIKNLLNCSQKRDKELGKRQSWWNKDQTLFTLCLELSSQFTVFLFSGLFWYVIKPTSFQSFAKSILAWLPGRCFFRTLQVFGLDTNTEGLSSTRVKVEPSIPLPSKCLLTRKLFQADPKYLWILLNLANCFALKKIFKKKKGKIIYRKICFISFSSKENILVLPNDRFENRL